MSVRDESRIFCPCGCEAEITGELAHIIRTDGPNTTLRTPFGSWRVPRAYIGIHGIRADTAADLAKHYGWLALP